MPSHDYSSASSGALKLKGGSGVDKKKKKKKKAQVEPSPVNDNLGKAINEGASRIDDFDGNESKSKKIREHSLEPEEPGLEQEDLKEWKSKGGKTESEQKYEETRRRRLEERLKREGIKTHKERVEDLNRYLSNLSEHHDMPRIGPG